MNMTHPDILEAERIGSPMPKEVGNCEACGKRIYEYEYVICELCEGEIHRACAVKCQCGQKGCKACMVETADGNWSCEEC